MSASVGFPQNQDISMVPHPASLAVTGTRGIFYGVCRKLLVSFQVAEQAVFLGRQGKSAEPVGLVGVLDLVEESLESLVVVMVAFGVLGEPVQAEESLGSLEVAMVASGALEEVGLVLVERDRVVLVDAAEN